MIKIDYAKIPDKLEELKELQNQYEDELEEICKEPKARMDIQYSNRETIFEYHRKVMLYFEQLEIQYNIENQIRALDKAGTEIPQALTDNLDKVKVAVIEADNKVKECADAMYAVLPVYLNDTAQHIGKQYKEWAANPKFKWEETKEGIFANQLIALNAKMKVTHHLWEESKSINTMKTQALESINILKECIKEIFYAEKKKFEDFKYTSADKLTKLKGTIAHLNALVEVKNQTKVLQYTESLLPENERGNLELENCLQFV